MTDRSVQPGLKAVRTGGHGGMRVGGTQCRGDESLVSPALYNIYEYRSNHISKRIKQRIEMK